MRNDKVQRRFCPDCGKDYDCTARQLMQHVMNAHPVKPTGTKRSNPSPLKPEAKRVQKDSGMTFDTPSTCASTSPQFRPLEPRTLQQDRNLAFGLDDSFMFRVYNAFHDQPREIVIRILRRGHLHPNDVNMLVSEAEEREVMVGKLIAAIVRTYRSKM